LRDSSADSVFNDKNLAKERVESFEKSNGKTLKEFNQKEIIVMTYEDLKERIHETNRKLEKHIEWGEKCYDRANTVMHNHDIAMQKITDTLKHITDSMPEKGFCEKVSNTLYAPDGTDKIEVLWNDRRWIKVLLGTLITIVTAFGGVNIAINFLG